MNKHSDSRKSTTLGNSEELLCMTKIDPPPDAIVPPYSLSMGSERASEDGDLPVRVWHIKSSIDTKDETKDILVKFRETAGKVEVADACNLVLAADKSGRWWLRHEITTRVSIHSWKWVLSARNQFGQEIFCLPRTVPERRRMGMARAEFWGVDKNIVSCFDAITTWVVAGFGEFQFDEE